MKKLLISIPFFLPMLYLVAMGACGPSQPSPGTSAEASPSPGANVTEKEIPVRYGFLDVICDQDNGNLIYYSDPGIYVIKDGCPKA
jgi:hypothetical protein